MRVSSTLLRPFAALAAIGLLVAACGGAASPSPAASAATTPSAAAPSVDVSPSMPASPSAEPSASGPDISGAAEAIKNLTGYELDVSVKGSIPGASGLGDTITVKAVVDRTNKAYEFTIGGMTGVPVNGLKVIVVGSDAWVDLGTGTYIKQPGGASSFGSTLDAFEPSALLRSIPTVALSGATKVGDEQKNGVATGHYHLDASNTPQLGESFGANGTVDFWIASEGGYMVSMVADGETTQDSKTSPMHMTMDLSRLNDPSINIQPPN